VAKLFQVDVVSPEAIVWTGEAEMVIARTPEGELGIMADHEPLMGSLATGPVSILSESGERTTIGVYGGFLQILNNQVTLITDRAQVTEDHAAATEIAAQLAAQETAADTD